MKNRAIQSFAKKAILRHIKELAGNIAKARKADIEGIHRLRVASRRLCNELWAFSSLFDGRNLKRWRKAIEKVAKACGDARDLDVELCFLSKLRRRIRKQDDKAGIGILSTVLEAKRRRLQSTIIKALDGIENKKTLAKIKKCVEGFPGAGTAVEGNELLVLSRSRIVKRLVKMQKYERFVKHPGKTRELHALRMAAKRLRYTLECFMPIYGKTIQKYIENAHRIQNILGLFHDYDVWMNSSPNSLIGKQKSRQTAGGIRCFIEECSRLKGKAYYQFSQFWLKLKREKQWNVLKKLLASKNH